MKQPCSGRIAVFEEIVAVFFEFESEFGTAGFDDLAIGHDVDDVWLDVVEEALVVSDDEEAALRRTHRVDPFGDDFESIDIEAGVGLIEKA